MTKTTSTILVGNSLLEFQKFPEKPLALVRSGRKWGGSPSSQKKQQKKQANIKIIKKNAISTQPIADSVRSISFIK